MKVELLLDAKAELAEGPNWCSLRQRLIWVDILRNQIHFTDPNTGNDEFVQLDVMVGAAWPYRDSKTLVIAAECGIGILNEVTGNVEWILDPEKNKPANRFNDGKVGPDGKFWAGTMRINGKGQGEGALYRFDLEKRTSEKVVEDVGLSNGLDWHDGKFYFVDTHERRIDTFDYDAGLISNRRPFYEVDEGFPDGLCVDDDGSVWLAQWGAGKVSHISHNGQLIQSVSVPATHVSSVFRWQDRLFISTACDHVENKTIDPKARSGSIYSLSLSE